MEREAEAGIERIETELDADGVTIKVFDYVDRRQYVGCFHCDAPICKLTNMEQSQPLVVEHMKVCPKHPMRLLESEITRLNEEVERLRAGLEQANEKLEIEGLDMIRLNRNDK